MPRPGFSIEVDDRTPPLVTLSGPNISLTKHGVGTRVVHPAEAGASADPVELVDAALEAPLGGEALRSRLRPDMRLTIVVLDDERPRPRMRFDVRRTLVERVLELAAAAGVADVAIVVAGGLNKRWSAYDITRVLGDRVATSFQPDGRIHSHDITSEALHVLGEVEGRQVAVDPRVATSDLVVAVGTKSGPDGSDQLARAVVDVETLRWLGAVDADPARTAAVGALIAGYTDVLAVQAVLGQPHLHGPLGFLGHREWEWGVTEKAGMIAVRQLGALAPRLAGRAWHSTPVADYAVLDIVAGEPPRAFDAAADVWRAANGVEVPGGADIVATGVWGGSFDDGDPVGSPINAAHHGLVNRLGACDGAGYTREGGVAVLWHPLRAKFSNRRQSSAADFFARVLAETTDPAAMADAEAAAVADAWYVDLYRKQFADHPLRTFQSWYRIDAATLRYADVIWVGANRRTAALLGHRAATTYADALELASDTVGSAPSVTVVQGPGLPWGIPA